MKINRYLYLPYFVTLIISVLLLLLIISFLFLSREGGLNAAIPLFAGIFLIFFQSLFLFVWQISVWLNKKISKSEKHSLSSPFYVGIVFIFLSILFSFMSAYHASLGKIFSYIAEYMVAFFIPTYFILQTIFSIKTLKRINTINKQT